MKKDPLHKAGCRLACQLRALGASGGRRGALSDLCVVRGRLATLAAPTKDRLVTTMHRGGSKRVGQQQEDLANKEGAQPHETAFILRMHAACWRLREAWPREGPGFVQGVGGSGRPGKGPVGGAVTVGPSRQRSGSDGARPRESVAVRKGWAQATSNPNPDEQAPCVRPQGPGGPARAYRYRLALRRPYRYRYRRWVRVDGGRGVPWVGLARVRARKGLYSL